MLNSCDLYSFYSDSILWGHYPGGNQIHTSLKELLKAAGFLRDILPELMTNPVLSFERHRVSTSMNTIRFCICFLWPLLHIFYLWPRKKLLSKPGARHLPQPADKPHINPEHPVFASWIYPCLLDRVAHNHPLSPLAGGPAPPPEQRNCIVWHPLLSAKSLSTVLLLEIFQNAILPSRLFWLVTGLSQRHVMAF